MQELNLKQHKVYVLIGLTAMIPLFSGGLITQLYHYLLPNWALLLSSIVIAATVAVTLFLIQKIRYGLSLEQFQEVIDTLSTPLIIADRQHQLTHVNQAAWNMDLDLAQYDNNLVKIFHEVFPSGFKKDEKVAYSAHLLDKLVAPLHTHHAWHNEKFKVIFKPIRVCNIRIGTLVEFQNASQPAWVQSAAETEREQAATPAQPLNQSKPTLQIEQLIAHSQQPILILDHNQTVAHINTEMRTLLNWTGEVNSSISWSELFKMQPEHVTTLFKEAFKLTEQTNFLQDATVKSKSVDWTVNPIVLEDSSKVYVIEAQSPSKGDLTRLRHSLFEIGTRADICEKEIAHFVNLIGNIDLYREKDLNRQGILDFKDYKHPLLKKGIKAVQRLADVVNESVKEANTIRQHFIQSKNSPNVNSNQFSVLSQALLRNVDELRGDYLALKNHLTDHQRIVNEQKGIARGLNQTLESGFLQTKNCREKTLAGFEMVTLVVQNLQQFETQLSVLLEVLKQTQSKIKKTQVQEDIALTLESFMKSLLEQLNVAQTHCKKNKTRLKLLIPHFTKHHLQMGSIQTQWQNGLALLQTQDNSLSEWRVFSHKNELYQTQIENRIDELYGLSEKALSKSYTIDGTYSNQSQNSSVISQQFDDIVMRNGLGDLPQAEEAIKNKA